MTLIFVREAERFKRLVLASESTNAQHSGFLSVASDCNTLVHHLSCGHACLSSVSCTSLLVTTSLSLACAVQEMGTKILQAALALHEKVAGTFRKTAVNFHYEFTVRHLANVFQGLLMSTPEQFNNVTKLSRLWLHESERVYADRLVSAAVSLWPAASKSCKIYKKSVTAVTEV